MVDAAGNAVSVTCSNEQRYGSAVVVPGTGILLNNQLTDFDEPGSANEARPGKRPLDMSPVIVVDGGGRPSCSAPRAAREFRWVSPRSSRTSSTSAWIRPSPSTSPASTPKCCSVELEQDRVPVAERQELMRRGHTIVDRRQYHPQFTPLVQMTGIRPDGRRFAVSDPRYDRGAAVL